MKQASRDMWEAIKDNPVAKSRFTELQLYQLQKGRAKITDFTWHHNAQSAPNSMQLIPQDIHSNSKVPHIGQNSLKGGQ